MSRPTYGSAAVLNTSAVNGFEASAAIYGGNPKTTANECVHWKDAVFSGALSPETIAHAVEDRERGTISATASKKLVELVLSTGKPFRTLRDEQGLTQVSDASALDVIVEKILAASPKEVESYRGGKVGLLSFFVGQVMRESRGKANPKVVQEVLKRKLG